MKTMIIFISLTFSLFTYGQKMDYFSIPLTENVGLEEKEEFKPFNVNFDWMLDTQTEVINGIWYSPTIEFNLNRPNGFNLQLQTGALPTLSGFKIDKTQPSAALSIAYRF